MENNYDYENDYSYDYDYLDTSVCMCKLENGEILYYDACGSDTIESAKEFYSKDHFEYIGSGSIYSINGVRQSFGKKLYHFFVKKIK